MRLRVAIPWVLLLALIVIAGTRICEQPICQSTTVVVGRLWTDLMNNAAAMSALVASILLVVTMYFHTKNLHATRLSNSAKMVMDLFERFDSEPVRKSRKEFAARLKADRANVVLSTETRALDLLEDVGHQARRGILDPEMVNSAFGWWINGYYKAVTTPSNLIGDLRKSTRYAGFYADFEWLHNKLVVEYRARARAGDFTTENLNAFLEEESTLSVSS